MKDFASVLVQFGSVGWAMWWLGRRHAHQKKKALRDVGPALVVSGICTLIGAKLFGLAVFGKRSVSRGEDAVDASLFMIVFGAAVFVLYYLVIAFIDAWRFIFPHRVKPPEEISACRCPKCGSVLGSRETRFCPVCEHHVVVHPSG